MKSKHHGAGFRSATSKALARPVRGNFTNSHFEGKDANTRRCRAWLHAYINVLAVCRIEDTGVDMVAMKSASFFLVYCLFATGFAKPAAVVLGYQDSLGQYSFGYSAPGSARSEVRTANGATRGTYSYIDETGVIQTTQYIADGEHGFQVIATNLPQAPLPVQDTPEVVAARTAHLQALELAARRDEEAQNQEIQENAQERKIEGNQSGALLSRSQEQPEAKSVENRQQEVEEKISKNAGNVEFKENSDETLQAVATKSGVDKESEKSQGKVHEEFSGKASQEIIHDANVPVIPLISSHERLPQSSVPIFRISLGNQEIEPSAIPESSIIVQGASGIVTPAGTALKSGAILTKEAAMPEKKQQTQPASEQAHAVNTLIAPLSIVPLSSSSFVRYTSPVSLYYVSYNIL